MVVGQKLFQCLQLLVIILIVSSRITLEQSTGKKVSIRCLKKEREALLKFKDELIDDYGSLSSWGSEKHKEDCCNWDGVRCDNVTNHIVELDLHSGRLRGGNISVSLLDIQHLKYLSLSGNDFNSSQIPHFIGSLRKLQHLDLSASHFSGEIPHHLGNLSELQFLDLGRDYRDWGLLTSVNLDWLSRLHSLRYLDLGAVNLSVATNWLETINQLIQLQELRLHNCHLPMVLQPSRFIFNSSISLHVLDLSSNELTSSFIFPLLLNSNLSYLSMLLVEDNKLQGPIPNAIGNLFTLSYLSLRHNQLEGKVPISLGNLSGLKFLGLSNNHLTGIVPHLSLSSSLIFLDLGKNMLNGTITQILKNLSKLEFLYLSSNYFQDIIIESHFFHLSDLIELDLSSNPGISFNFSLQSNPHFQLEFIDLSGCKVGPLFPTWLRTQKGLETLYISNGEISGTFPDWFWELSQKLQSSNVSHNNFHGPFLDLSSKFSSLTTIDLSFNHFNGSLPILPPTPRVIIFKNNEFSGPVTKLCNGTDFNWMHVDLSNNLLSGQLPDCFANLRALGYLNLAHNNFSGEIPSLSNGALSSLHLENNHFTGGIPTSLKNCTSLAYINLSQNRLMGKIPTWIGDTWSNLVFLSLKSNEFFGSLPSNLCHLVGLQVLEISLNKIFGSIPTCIYNFTTMSHVDSDFNRGVWTWAIEDFWIEDSNSTSLTWKGVERGYQISNLKLMKFIDLSNNNLVGDVPVEITSLVALYGLNLSRNNLSGTIPSNIGQLRSLNVLDLSRNQFTGEIPIGIAQIDQLGMLDLSNNNLSGKIPQSNHMQTFNDSAFEENNGLCGLPLRRTCPGDEIGYGPRTGDNGDGDKSQEDDEKFIDYGFFISIALGFVFGFWGVYITLLFNNSWRITFFELCDKVIDWCHVRIAFSKIRFKEAFQKFVNY